MKDMAYTKDFANKYNAVKATEKSLDKKYLIHIGIQE